MTEPEQPPEGVLIERALARTGISKREAAKRSGITEGRLRQIQLGFIRSHGNFIPQTAKPETLARIADALGMSVAELRDAGRDDAADLLDARQEHKRTDPIAAGLGIAEITAWIRTPSGSPPIEMLTLFTTKELLDEIERRAADWGRVPDDDEPGLPGEADEARRLVAEEAAAQPLDDSPNESGRSA